MAVRGVVHECGRDRRGAVKWGSGRADRCAGIREEDRGMSSVNRRRYERFELPAAYTEVKVLPETGQGRWLSGHAYDISEGGVRLELDEELAAGTPVRVRLMLPVGEVAPLGPVPGPVEIEAEATIVWSDDDGVRGPVQLAASFERFARAGDRERLVRRVVEGRFRRAA